MLINKEQELTVNKKRTDRASQTNQSCWVAPTIQFSNLFLEDLKRLFDLEPVLPVDLITPKTGVLRAFGTP